jgi:hypothetical protein
MTTVATQVPIRLEFDKPIAKRVQTLSKIWRRDADYNSENKSDHHPPE